MFKLSKILCHPKSSSLKSKKVKQQEQKGIQYSYTSLEQNKDKDSTKLSSCRTKKKGPISTRQEKETSIPNFEDSPISQELKLQLNVKQMGETKDNYCKESEESITKIKKHYSEDPCNSRTCSNENCNTDGDHRLIDKKRLSEKNIDQSKLTEIINSSIKEAMQTLIKQCAMDEKKSILVEDKYKDCNKIDRCRKRQDTSMIRKFNDDNRCVQRTRCYPCDYTRKSDKRGSSIKSCKPTTSKCHDLQDTCRDKDKKDGKTAKNVKTDNRRMTGNVNIYICSEANEDAQRKEKQKQKSQSCTESSSETTTERTESTCARTSSLSSDNKLTNNVVTRCPNSEEEHSDNSFSTPTTPCVVDSNESNGNCCVRKYDDSLEDLNMDDNQECSTMSSRSMDIDDSTVSSISSTRDGCCCRDTTSSYIDPCFKPRFTIYNDKLETPCSATIYPKCTTDDRRDSWIQRSICTKEPEYLRCGESYDRCVVDRRCNYCDDSFKCYCKKRPRFRSISRRRSSFDVLHAKGLHRKWSKCSCIVEEDELEGQCTNVSMQQRTICRNNFDNPNIDDQDETTSCRGCRIHGLTDDQNKNPGNVTKNDNTLDENNVITCETLSNGSGNPTFKKRLNNLSKTQTEMSSVQQTRPVIKHSATSDIVEKPKVTIVTKQQPSSEKTVPSVDKRSDSSVKQVSYSIDKNLLKERPEVSEEKGPKQTNLSEKRSKSGFLGRSFKRAINMVKQNKTQPTNNPGKDNVDNNPKDNRTNFPIVSKTIQPNNPEIETFSSENKNIGNPGNSGNPVNPGNPGTYRKTEQRKKEEEDKMLESSKLTGNPNKRPKTKLQNVLQRKPLKLVKGESEDTKHSENDKDDKCKREHLTDKDATGDFADKSGIKEMPCERKQKNLSCMEDRYSYRQKCSKPITISKCCCYCRLPVVDCTCEYHPPLCECRPVLEDNCECVKPLTCDELCQTADFYSRYEVYCIDCQKPKDKCCCNINYIDHCIPNYEGPCNGTTICVYCEYPREKCICRSSIRKCSYCDLTFDECKCNREYEIYDGRPIVTDCKGDQKICVTAWKPKPEIRRYFSRNFDAFPSDSLDECYCRKTHKTYGFNDLPYQRLSVFSDVMSELQQKISDSLCCDRCKMTPCCCRGFSKNVENDERKGRCYVSSKFRQRSRSPEVEHTRGKSCNNRRCGRSPDRNVQRRICYSCKALPCKCKKGKSTTKRPRAKCYYCKSCPCTCINRELNKSRSCKCGDSTCRTKEKETTVCGKAFNDARKKNEEKVLCSRD